MFTTCTSHYTTILHILRYIIRTLFNGLHFPTNSSLHVYVYSDTNWDGDPTDRRSIIVFCFLLGDSLISWRSKKLTIVSRSSIITKYRVIANTTDELLWLRWLLEDIGIVHCGSTTLNYDNQSAIKIAHNDIFHD